MVLKAEDLEAANKKMKEISAEFLAEISQAIGIFRAKGRNVNTRRELRKQISGAEKHKGIFWPMGE